MFGKKIDTDILLPGLYGNKIWALITKRHNGENRGGQVSGLRNNEGEFSDRVSLVVWRGDEGEQEVSLGMCQLVFVRSVEAFHQTGLRARLWGTFLIHF